MSENLIDELKMADATISWLQTKFNKLEQRYQLSINRLKSLQEKLEQFQTENKRLKEIISTGIILKGKGLEALQSMASVDFMIKACTGSLTAVDVAESINGILIKAKKDTEQALEQKGGKRNGTNR